MASIEASLHPSEEDLTELPASLHLGPLDTKVLLASVLCAIVLAAMRLLSKRPPPNNQFLYDMLGVWTVVELLLIVIADLDPNVVGIDAPDVVEIIKSNGALLPFALLYCAWAVAVSTVKPTFDQFRATDKEDE